MSCKFVDLCFFAGSGFPLFLFFSFTSVALPFSSPGFCFTHGETAFGDVCGLVSLRNILSLRLTFHSSRYNGFRGVLPSS